MRIEHEDIVIRNAEKGDCEKLAAWWNDGSVMAHAGFPLGLGTTAAEIEEKISHDSDTARRRLIIEYQGCSIGEMNYTVKENGVAEIGIKICETDQQNKGLGKIVLSLLIRELFSKGYAKIILDTNLNNKRAQHVYEKLGFRKVRVCVDAWKDQLGIPQSAVDYELIKENFVDFSQTDLTGGKKTVFCKDRSEWRKWLSEHFETESEIWFVFPSADSGEAGVSYNDAVEEALCFGWIDGKAGTLDKTHQLRRFTPRRKGSTYSQPNIERLIWLDGQGMIYPNIRPSVEGVISKPFVFPEDIIEAIRSDEEAWKNYQNFTEPYKRIRVAYIDAARKRPAEFKKRLENFIKKTKENKLIVGYGGVDKYYE